MANLNIILAGLALRTILGLYWLARHLNLIQVTGWEKTATALQQGRVLIISNHPSLLETWMLPALCWRLPAAQVPWTVADQDLMPRGWAAVFRLILVNRRCDQKSPRLTNGRAVAQARRIIRQSGNIILYPEGGRTCKGEVAFTLDDRELRSVQTSLIARLAQEGVVIIPVWVSHGVVRKPQGYGHGFLRLFLGTPLVITFGKPLIGEVTDAQVAKAILTAGREPD